jgi:hypothetical protein
MPVKSKGSSGVDESEFHRFNVVLSRDVEDLLEDLRQKIRKGRGLRVNKSEIIRAAIRNLGTLRLRLADIKDESDLLQRIIEASRK